MVVADAEPRSAWLGLESVNARMDPKNIDEALQRMTTDEDAPQVSPSDELQLPPGSYLPDSLERREKSQEKKPMRPRNNKRKQVDVRLSNFMALLRDAQFETSFLTNLEVMVRHTLDQLWYRLSQCSHSDAVYVYFMQTVKTGQFVVYICNKVAVVLGERREYSKSATLLIKRIEEQTKDISEFAQIDAHHVQLSGGGVLPLAQWLPRERPEFGSSLGSGGGSSSGCSSPTSSIGGSSSGLGGALTPRVHSKNPRITRLLPWHVIKGFAQCESVASIFEAYAATDETPHTGREMYIFVDCTVIALARSILQNEYHIAHASQPGSPTKRRHDGVESQPETAHDDRAHVTRSLVEYIQFIHDHASDLHSDDTVSITTLIERHLQELLPCASEYLRECEFVGF